jgi:peptide deformylase
MPARRILQLGDPLLRRVSRQVERPADSALIVRDLRATLNQFQGRNGFGRGISAVQIGELRRVIYIEFEARQYILINPVIEWASENRFVLWDDCFSFPNLMVRLERAVAVRVRHQDLDGAVHTIEAEGAFSELLQHEVDHLDGVLAVDRAVGRDALCTREEFLRRGRDL